MATYPSDANITRYPDRGFNISSATAMDEFISLSGYSRRKLRSRRLLRTFSFTYSSIDQATMNKIENFYNARAGQYESFHLDLTHFNLQGITTVRFNSELVKEHVIDGNNNSWFNVTLTMAEL